MVKKAQKAQEKADVKELRIKAKDLDLDPNKVLDFVLDGDIAGLQKEIETAEAIKKEQGQIDELIQGAGLNKQALNILGLTARNDWNFYTQAGTKWLLPVAKIMLSQEWKEFLNSDFRLKDYEKLLPVFKK